MHNSGELRREIADLYLEFHVIAIHSFFTWRDGLLRFARNDSLVQQ